MKKSFFILVTISFILLFSTVCFASDMGNNIKNTVNGATNSIVDGTQNLAEDIRDGINSAESTIENGLSNIGNAIMDGTNDVITNDENNYETRRIAAEDVSAMDTTEVSTWTWIAIAIAAFVIVGLVWYYASEHNHKH